MLYFWKLDRKSKMKQNKIHLLILIFIATFLQSCEHDDICIDEITPHLIIRLYDKANTTALKKINKVDIAIVGLDRQVKTIEAKDSILLPIDVSKDITQYILTINSKTPETKQSDTITISYTREDIFVGRSCGYKTIFNDMIYKLDSDNWIHHIESISSQIENENNAHVKIFF